MHLMRWLTVAVIIAVLMAGGTTFMVLTGKAIGPTNSNPISTVSTVGGGTADGNPGVGSAIGSILDSLVASIIDALFGTGPVPEPRLDASSGISSGINSGVIPDLSPTDGRQGRPDPNTVLMLLNLDLVLLLLLGILVGGRAIRLWQQHRQGQAGSQLHGRVALSFGLVAAVPAVIMAVFSGAFFTTGLQNWFSDQVQEALDNAVAAARAYRDEHQQNLRANALAVAIELNRNSIALMDGKEGLSRLLHTLATTHNLIEANVFDASGQILGRYGLTLSLDIDPIPSWVLEQARSGEVQILTSSGADQVRAVVRLDRLVDTYLYVARLVDPRVLSLLQSTSETVDSFHKLEDERSGFLITFSATFVVLSLLLVLTSLWIGLALANQLATPIKGLIEAAERVRTGDLNSRIPLKKAWDELAVLIRSFNRMTDQLRNQRSALVTANEQLAFRRRFTEAVLAGVSAGVIGLDGEGRINLPNRAAARFLDTPLEGYLDQKLADVVPEFASLVERARNAETADAEEEIDVVRSRGRRHLLVRITSERADGETLGYVITFDDVTKLVVAQRTAAWANVARRIAHEIKNPLTPIQLSAERLQRKYQKEIVTDPDVFTLCTDTIIRRVTDIGHMVNEFSAFARMPAPLLRPTDIGRLVRESVELHRPANAGIELCYVIPPEPTVAEVDAGQVSQILSNLLQNAADAVQQKPKDEAMPPIIEVELIGSERETEILVTDNGPGFPNDVPRERLMEPYITQKERGTGLGLAIVKRIAEDHGARFALEDVPGGGARVRVAFIRHARRHGGRAASEILEEASEQPASSGIIGAKEGERFAGSPVIGGKERLETGEDNYVA